MPNFSVSCFSELPGMYLLVLTTLLLFCVTSEAMVVWQMPQNLIYPDLDETFGDENLPIRRQQRLLNRYYLSGSLLKRNAHMIKQPFVDFDRIMDKFKGHLNGGRYGA
ncbi:unnamed protein product [Enterobius vermicularis]|uniref:Uncharacterized protein n=1 Tax=Enterobius vermicularis TaxID=51028 RepID=A0A0N4V1H9_ENTVE|nr:unnamed protein product [Enterobius vermicularis]